MTGIEKKSIREILDSNYREYKYNKDGSGITYVKAGETISLSFYDLFLDIVEYGIAVRNKELRSLLEKHSTK